jgi:hypothetical protein
MPRTRTTVIAGKRYPIEDALIDGHITITHKHVRLGVPGDPAHCALSLGTKDSMRADEAYFFKTRALLLIDGTVYRWTLPQRTSVWIIDFDSGRVTVPKGTKVTLYLTRPPRRSRLGLTHLATHAHGARGTVPPGARAPIGTIGGSTGVPRGGYSGPGSYKTAVKP